ncbi:V-type ATP synthase subunit E [Prolixibacteraceae bacterium Z1-6]|uniref:V-type ATP synthase subunit E n=1 Tax=Draconibacterium aestuarii TaxID=2998507 RepID=A0A9X3J4Q2_9BACT|nr:V-type ATP synthase subunit E [Prolixibacteraceae bacterium Z1-6]
MSDKIQEITQKIYNEGVIKAREDAEQIIADAKTKAEQIIHSAHRKQEEIISVAQKQADEIKRKTDTEMQLAARQFISKLKQKITTVITASQVDKPVKNALSDVDFVKKIIQIIINNWNPGTTEDLNLKVLLPAKEEKEFSAFFDSKMNDSLNKGVEVSFDEKLETGFKIGPQDGSYIISFTDKDFENYFKGYIKDRTKKLLFEPVEQE